jgi:glycosyltransferase involved in cell wall biosynthesis
MRVAAAGRRRYDVIMDVQNGVPFWTPLVTGVPVVSVVHHVHREQWPEVFGTTRAKVGWWLESAAAPRAYRAARYIAVSSATRDELVGLGVSAERIEVVLSGLDAPTSSVHYDTQGPPSLVVLGRLVPHKRVELALETLARLRPTWPDLSLTVVGQGYWLPELQAHSERLGVDKAVRFAGFVSDVEKADLLAAARVNLLPSLKEGWGLAIVEAASLGTPSVAMRSAGGTAESIVDGETGLLAAGEVDFVEQVSKILADAELRERLSAGARSHAAQFSWDRTGDEVLSVLAAAASSRRRGQAPS